jgi:hypothetical protein
VSPGSVIPAWIDCASRRLATGDDIGKVFLGLLSDGAVPDDAAVAVCVAAGSRRQEAVERLRDFAGLWGGLEPGEEPDGVDLLIAHGYFEADAVLDDQQQAALTYLGAALKAVSGIPSGFAASLFTKLRTGRLVEAFRQLERLGAQRWPDNTCFWSAMRPASEILQPSRNQSTPST